MTKIYLLIIAFLTYLSLFAAAKASKQTNVNGTVLDEQRNSVDYATVGLFKASDSTFIKAAKVEYTLPINKSTKFEAGVKSSWVETDNDLRAEEWKNNVWQNDVRRSNRFVYNENVNAAYANFNKQFKQTNVQLGLKMEQTNSKGNLITDNNVVARSYWDFFPTIYVQQTISKNHQLGASYGRRIDRPSYDALNPFIYFLDEYTYNKGNPFLKPQYTNNYELNYTLKQKYFLNLGYSVTNDAITEVILPNTEQKALYQTNENLETQTV